MDNLRKIKVRNYALLLQEKRRTIEEIPAAYQKM